MKELALICLLWVATVANSQTIYKLVDAEGHVTYSSTSPAEGSAAEEIAPPPEPTPEAVEAARQQQQELEQSLKEKRSERKLQEQQQAEQQQQVQQRVIQQQVIPVPVIRDVPVYRRPGRYPARRPPVVRPRPLPAVRP